tara:strand:- start:765 stop:1187 length:423 start_codon:yes stop_codon:yes gene_type:complete
MESITVVCFANYCRSPVAEVILKERFKDKFIVRSAGLRPFPGLDMDKRSRDFLLQHGYSFDTHIPQKITLSMINESKLVFALDELILMEMNKKFRHFNQNIKMLNFQKKLYKFPDPYQQNEDEYQAVMNNIKYVCESLNI